MDGCSGYGTFVAKDDGNYYLIIVCLNGNRNYVKKCIGLKVSGNTIKCLSSDVSVQFPFQVHGLEDTIEGGIQSYGNWLVRRMTQNKARLGYFGEMLVKMLAYIICKERGNVVKCLKSSTIKTRKGIVGWKAVYQMFLNTKDLPRTISDVVRWNSPLPEECIRLSSSGVASSS